MPVLSIVEPVGRSRNTCGYCSEPGRRSAKASSISTGLVSAQLSCEASYLGLRGWRRSGKYVYKPDLYHSCCPQYTIRLSALDFKPSKTQRKLISKWNRFILDSPGEKPPLKANGYRAKDPSEISSLQELLHASEASFVPESKVKAHTFTMELEPSSYSAEKFALYCQYQEQIHKDLDKQPSGFERFLVDNPLVLEDIKYTSGAPKYLPSHYGAYHQLYRVDGELIAIGVIDILPCCVSSVYFIYSPSWGWASLGKLSALREIALAKEMNVYGVNSMQYQYMGFYIHTCPKMRYKGEYQSSYLLDPETYVWHPITNCVPELEKHPYVSFSDPSRFRDAPPSFPSPVGSEDSDDEVADDDAQSPPQEVLSCLCKSRVLFDCLDTEWNVFPSVLIYDASKSIGIIQAFQHSHPL
ncbi:arginine-tRNA-protein transferase [Cantharellus anzutake]|uniref:arginine-tRNA-protein transferase n=1 Tax=Cantharellus anzutake TaxID=1750568 RepID=UPI00190550A9|nr:arginine-tRNA-protein transferase [Cantharellus anzutake]KAF8341479.1 arginine-tRNA-protein transferase [Cantharellus anzutake]